MLACLADISEPNFDSVWGLLRIKLDKIKIYTSSRGEGMSLGGGFVTTGGL